MSRPIFPLAALALAAPLAGCSYVPRIPGVTPYRIEVQQGNFISQEMVSQLKAGMSREQVRFVLGTPLLADAFHGDRWDYIYWREAPDGRRESRKLVVFFADDKLQRLDGDIAPGMGLAKEADTAPAPAAAGGATAAPGQSAPPVPQAPVAPATQTPPAEEKR
jgi:outer membrane protein assembly factor BamE